MKKSFSKSLAATFAILFLFTTAAVVQTENAAPSEHIYFDFPEDAIAKIHQIKVTQSADAEYFSAHNFRGGYNGLQQTPDKKFGTPYILIASLWDPNTAGNVFSKVAYSGANTFTGRFGGEGDGWKTINPYKWTVNVWYTIAIRSWKNNGSLFIATFIRDMSTGVWFHTSTLEQADRPGYLGKSNDAFLENWDGYNPTQDGRFVRKAFFKDCWNLNENNTWQKHTKRSFRANERDQKRNGKYDRSFNAGYDAAEDAYFMQHGGDTKPDMGFGTGRTLSLPDQAQQGNAPNFNPGTVSVLTANYVGETINIKWTDDVTKTPQLSSKVEILNILGKVVYTVDEVSPEKRFVTINASLPAGRYTARVTLTDIFNQVSKPVENKFVVAGK